MTISRGHKCYGRPFLTSPAFSKPIILRTGFGFLPYYKQADLKNISANFYTAFNNFPPMHTKRARHGQRERQTFQLLMWPAYTRGCKNNEEVTPRQRRH